MEPPEAFLLLLLLGILTDVVWTIAVRCIEKRKIHLVALCNAILAAVSMGSAYFCIESKSVIDIGAYVIGCYIGSYLAFVIKGEKQVSSKKNKCKRRSK